MSFAQSPGSICKRQFDAEWLVPREERTEMSKVMVRYTVKPEAAATNEELVRSVYDELSRVHPAGFHYATFVLDDGVSFVHIASKDGDAGMEPLTELAAFRAFVGGINERSIDPPISVAIREIGSFAFWGV